MENIREALFQSLQTGFIDYLFHSNSEYLPKLLVNDKTSGKTVLSTIQRELEKCDEFRFSVAFVTTSGIASLIQTLIDLQNRGIKGKILVSQYLNFTQPAALERLLQFKNIELKIAVTGDFHSKGYLFRKNEIYNLIIGSSNLTQNALKTNIEWNLKVSATYNSALISRAIIEFDQEFQKAIKVDKTFIDLYSNIYNKERRIFRSYTETRENQISVDIHPNKMQIEALANINNLRAQGKTKALLISATGTGKTFLSAFDAREFNPKRFLFVVHRLNIAKAALKSFSTIFGKSRSMGIFSGEKKELDKDFLFCTVQTISKKENLELFKKNEFDYIVIDETHRAGAESYQKVLDYFTPKFLLGMTATPERTDGYDIFKLFDYNIAYEIRLHKALEEDMLSPFHYYGVTDISVGGRTLEDNSEFKLLTSEERVKHIIEKAKFYGCDDGEIRGLIFCSKVEECTALSIEFNKRGLKTIALSGINDDIERSNAIDRLETDDPALKLDYIFTVDIFNEGIDIPRVNQIIMLRPTQSAIVFVQQLGRGLRKLKNKEYLTVIDFIGNYNNNFLVPIALYGDTSYNKDTLRKMMSSGSAMIPGASTVNFDLISRNRIFEAINTANMELKKDLVKDYKLLEYKLGRYPMMMDFIRLGSRDPQLYSNYSKSYFNFVQDQEDELKNTLNQKQIKLLELFSNEVNNAVRIEESLILTSLIENRSITFDELKINIKKEFGFDTSKEIIESAISNLNFEFVTENKNKELKSVRSIYGFNIVNTHSGKISLDTSFLDLLKSEVFKRFLLDSTEYSISTFSKHFNLQLYKGGFSLYQKYSRKDVFRILNWDKNPLAQNVGGYIISSDKSNCPIFVTYEKEEDISSTTKYHDAFVNRGEFDWMSKSRRTLNSPDVLAIKNYKNGLRIPLFIKKSNDEGSEFYYMGDIHPIDNSFEQTTMKDDNGNDVSVVKIRFLMEEPVEENIYNYITNSQK